MALIALGGLLLVSCGSQQTTESTPALAAETLADTAAASSNLEVPGTAPSLEIIPDPEPTDRSLTEEPAQRPVQGSRDPGSLVSLEDVRAQLDPDTASRLDELGIKEVIGHFTTYYTAGEDRVINIERMGELTRGAIIGPGETFSLNNHVGDRTLEKGFVAADGLSFADGLFKVLGGGVSQYTSTLFNAGFFAGLDFTEYQAHTYHFPRYPYGREATIDFDSIDLKIHNITLNSILIWSSHTDDSTTVQIFGTKFFTRVEAVVPQIETPNGSCTKVETRRERTFPDGRGEIDSFFALYQAELGQPCNQDSSGNRLN